tara:strand:- start:5177 stop:5593 length:417 start_codon:yes stop_codon:yes gene_type:complete
MEQWLATKNCKEMIMTFNDVNVLGNLVNTTYGKMSSPAGDYSIKCDLAGNTMTLKYTTLVHFVSETGLTEQVNRCKEESHSRLLDYVTKLKKDFKEASGNALKLTDVSMSDNVELIQSTSNSPRKVAYYRMNHTLEME